MSLRSDTLAAAGAIVSNLPRKNKFFNSERSMLAVYGSTLRFGASELLAVNSNSYRSLSLRNSPTFGGSTDRRIGEARGAKSAAPMGGLSDNTESSD